MDEINEKYLLLLILIDYSQTISLTKIFKAIILAAQLGAKKLEE